MGVESLFTLPVFVWGAVVCHSSESLLGLSSRCVREAGKEDGWMDK